MIQVFTGICGFVAAAIPPEGGTTNFRLKAALQTGPVSLLYFFR